MRLAPLAIGLAACGSAAAPARPVANLGGGGCPGADTVRIASFVTGITEGTRDGAPDPHWHVALAVRPADDPWADPPEPAAPGWEDGPRTAAQARALAGDVGPIEGTAWIFRDPGPPCAAALRGYEVVTLDAGGGPYRLLAAVLTGCAPEAADAGYQAWAVIGDDARGCEYAPAAALTSRELPDDASGPAAPPAWPAALASAIPARACTPPACEPLWRVARVADGARAVYDAHATWLHPDPAVERCGWAHEDAHGLFLGDAGAARTAWPGTDDGPPREVALDGALRDRDGLRLVLATAVDDYAVIALDPDGWGPSRVERWYVAHPEDGAWYSLAPYCGP